MLKRTVLALAAGVLLTPVVQAATLELSVEIPRLQVAEYHRPYVAMWLENERNEVTNLAVWYDVAMRENEGLEWLKDMRQWWRRSGRTLELPLDGLTGATKPPGEHRLVFGDGGQPLPELPPGQYRLRVEAAREVGGRELLEIPFQWPLSEETALEVSGTEELGRVTLRLAP
ncbi:MAG: DUF2271 domain-containing protein [Porticoccaceae bacterium]